MKNLFWLSLIFVISSCSQAQCSNTSYGNGVVCVNAHGAGSGTPNETSRTVGLAPTAGHAVIVAAYQCWDALCATTGTTTLTLSDNVNHPETCFTKSPHSPFTLVETSAGAQHLQQYMWYCPSIPSGVTTFTVTCSAPLSCSYITAWVTEWTGLTSDATVAAFDTDGGATSTIQNTTSSVSTQAATRYTKDLIFACGDNTADRLMTPGAPHLQVNQFFPGNMCMASPVTAAGSVQTATATWIGNDDWYFTIAAIRSAGSVLASSALLVPDGTSLKRAFGPYPDVKWFAMGVEPDKTYAIEVTDVDNDLSANAIGAVGLYDVDGVSPPPEASVDCTPGNAPRPPAVGVTSGAFRCVLRTALPTAGMQQNKRPVYIKVTSMNPATGGGSQFRVRAREATIYGRWLTAGYDYHIEVENTSGEAMCVEVARYPTSGLAYTAGPGWAGAIDHFVMAVPAFGAVKQVISKGSLVGADSEGTLRVSGCGSPTNLVPGALHVSTYAFDAAGNRYLYFFTSTANDGKTRSTW